MSGLTEQQVNKLLDRKIDELENKINGKINAALNRLRNDLEKKISEEVASGSNGGQNNKQLALVAQKNAEIAVRNVMDKEFMPQFKAFAEDIREKTMDGDELITQYRKRVVNGEALKMLTSSPAQSPAGKTSRSDFASKIFVFKEDD